MKQAEWIDAPANAAESRQLDLPTKVVVLLGGLVAALSLMAIQSVLPQIDRALVRSPGDHMLVKQLVGGVGLAMVLGSVLVGFLIDRIGARRVLVGSALLYVLSGTAGLYIDELRVLLGSRLLLGIAASGIQITCFALINAKLTGVTRARWMGLHISVAMLGTIAVHPIAGALGELGWRWPFALYAIGLVLLPAALALRDRPPIARVADAAPAVRGLRWLPVHYLALAMAIGSVAFMTMVQVPFLLREQGLVKPSLIALVLTADSAAGALMAMFYGRARMRISAHTAFIVSFSLVAVGCVIAATAPSLVAMIVGLLIYGAGIGWMVPNLMTSLASKLEPRYQGRATGMVKSAHYLAAPVSVALIEPVTRAHGPGSALLAAAAVSLLCLLAITLRRAKVGGQPRGMPIAL